MRRTLTVSRTLMLALAALSLCHGRAAGAEHEESATQRVFTEAVKRVAPSLVSVTVEWKPGKAVIPAQAGQPAFERGNGPFSALVISEDGLIITSDFNVNSDARRIIVKLADGRTFDAEALGRDVSRGLQLLRVQADGLSVPEFAADEQVKVGRWALACGVSEPDAPPTLSVGIVSATGRITGRAIQIDALTNPGNYGGPLVDIEGRVMGILTPLTPSGTRGGISLYDSGVGFAVPVTDIREQLPKLKAGEVIRSAFLGIRFDMRKLSGGATVVEVLSDTGAAKAGIRPGDVIIEFNGEPIDTSFKLLYAIGKCRVGEVVKFKVIRNGGELDLTATLGARPERSR